MICASTEMKFVKKGSDGCRKEKKMRVLSLNKLGGNFLQHDCGGAARRAQVYSITCSKPFQVPLLKAPVTRKASTITTKTTASKALSWLHQKPSTITLCCSPPLAGTRPGMRGGRRERLPPQITPGLRNSRRDLLPLPP